MTFFKFHTAYDNLERVLDIVSNGNELIHILFSILILESVLLRNTIIKYN